MEKKRGRPPKQKIMPEEQTETTPVTPTTFKTRALAVETYSSNPQEAQVWIIPQDEVKKVSFKHISDNRCFINGLHVNHPAAAVLKTLDWDIVAVEKEE